MLRYINDGGEMPLCRDSDDGNQELGLQSSEVNTNRSAVIDHLSLIIDVMRNLAQICTVKSRVQYALMYNTHGDFSLVSTVQALQSTNHKSQTQHAH